jgi:hypothetical protein
MAIFWDKSSSFPQLMRVMQSHVPEPGRHPLEADMPVKNIRIFSKTWVTNAYGNV